MASGGEEEELETERGFHRYFRGRPESYPSSPWVSLQTAPVLFSRPAAVRGDKYETRS